jgi:hypothetical protein
MDALTKEDDRRPHVVPVPVAPEAVRLTTLQRLITHHVAATRQTTKVSLSLCVLCLEHLLTVAR